MYLLYQYMSLRLGRCGAQARRLALGAAAGYSVPKISRYVEPIKGKLEQGITRTTPDCSSEDGVRTHTNRNIHTHGARGGAPMETRVYSLEPEAHEGLVTLLQRGLGGGGRCTLEALDLRSLRDVGSLPPCDLIVLCHEMEGRTLLLDADGLYNSFVAAAHRATASSRSGGGGSIGGNYVICLTGTWDCARCSDGRKGCHCA